MVKIGFIRYWYCNSQNWPKYLVEKLNSVKESFQYVDAHKVDTSGLLQLNAANQMGSSGKITMASSYTPTGSYDLITKTYMENNTIDKCYIIATSAPTDAASKKKFWINSSKGNGTINYWTGSVWKEISASYT